MDRNKDDRPVRQSLKEYAQGVAGGLLFSLPLLYTMEVWWAGFIASPRQLILLMVATYLLLLGYNRFAGMHPDVSWRSVMVDSVEEMGIGLLLSFGVLLMLNRINFEMALDEVMGKIIIEAMAVSIGVSIGTAQLGSGDEEEDEEKPDEEEKPGSRNNTLGMVVLALCGSIVVGGNVAPTEEVLVLATGAAPVHILFMALASLALSLVVVYFSNFKGASGKPSGHLGFNVILDTCLCYLVALGASAFALWFFGRFDGVSFEIAFAEVIVLGVLASLGASAGRLLIR